MSTSEKNDDDKRPYEEPPELTQEDEDILDRVWARVAAEERAKKSSAPPDPEVA